jgi:hypothetical protein
MIRGDYTLATIPRAIRCAGNAVRDISLLKLRQERDIYRCRISVLFNSRRQRATLCRSLSAPDESGTLISINISRLAALEAVLAACFNFVIT